MHDYEITTRTIAVKRSRLGQFESGFLNLKTVVVLESTPLGKIPIKQIRGEQFKLNYRGGSLVKPG